MSRLTDSILQNLARNMGTIIDLARDDDPPAVIEYARQLERACLAELTRRANSDPPASPGEGTGA